MVVMVVGLGVVVRESANLGHAVMGDGVSAQLLTVAESPHELARDAKSLGNGNNLRGCEWLRGLHRCTSLGCVVGMDVL